MKKVNSMSTIKVPLIALFVSTNTYDQVKAGDTPTQIASSKLINEAYIDNSVKEANVFQKKASKKVFQENSLYIFTPGKPGFLLVYNEWLNKVEIAHWSEATTLTKELDSINIYGCNFAQGNNGKQAGAYLETALGVSIAVSDDLTGKDVDWDLEAGTLSSNASLVKFSTATN